jgi:hypothetical protein
MPEVMEEIPELPEVARGGLQQALKNLIDDARMWVVKRLGAGKKQAVAYGLQRRSRRTLGKRRQDSRRASSSKTFLPTDASNL